MLPDRGAAIEFVEPDPTWLEGVVWLHVPSYSLLSEPIGSASRALIDDLRRRGGRLSIDVSSVAEVDQFGVQRYASLLGELEADVVFANEPESRLLPHSGSTLTIVKDGPRPVRVRGPSGGIRGGRAATARGRRLDRGRGRVRCWVSGRGDPRRAHPSVCDVGDRPRRTVPAQLAVQHDRDRDPRHGVVEGPGERVAVELQ